jgi:two-component system, OmpR family, sensor kinase
MKAVVTVGLLVLLGVQLLLYRQYREQRDAVDAALHDRLLGLLRTAVAWGGDRPDAEWQRLLTTLAHDHHLEDAYLVDDGFHVIAGVRTRAGERVNLLRLDVPRAERAWAGQPSSGAAYTVDGEPILAAYAPVGTRLLALEGGSEFAALPRALERSHGVTAALTGLLGLLLTGAAVAVVRARRAAARIERLADLGQMAALVAHEVRNPLGILRGHIELLGERLAVDAPPRERERIREMLEEVDRLNAVSGELLTLGRERGPRQAVAVEALVAEVVRRIARARPHAVVEVEVPPALTVVAEESKLGQALFNLVLNAAQVGGDGVTIKIAGREAPGDTVVLTVEDDGPGVPPTLRRRLFEPFVTGRQDGRGLGLAVARQVAERHGGRLELERARRGERGARFSLWLPREGGEAWRES